MSINLGGQPSYIQALNAGLHSWTGNAGQTATISYSFDPSYRTGSALIGSPTLTYAGALSTAQQSDVGSAFGKWATFADLIFQPTTGAPKIDFYSSTAPTGDLTGGRTGGNTGTQITSAEVTLTQYSGASGIGNYGFELTMHEIGHALGLSHPNNNANDLNRDLTIMSYTNGTVVFGTTTHNAITPMIYDVAAIQFLYGQSNTGLNASNSFTLDSTKSQAQTIWDAGGSGSDTITVNNIASTVAATIDLRGGIDTATGNPYWSHFGSDYMDIAFDPDNASGVVDIEKAIGGAGNDKIYGGEINNELTGNSGNDTIYGDGDKGSAMTYGDDVIYGGANTDTLYGDAGKDTLPGSTSTVGGADEIHGGADADVIYGEGGADHLYGDGGNDKLYGGVGDDNLTGGAGDDYFYFYKGNGHDTITDPEVTDHLVINGKDIYGDYPYIGDNKWMLGLDGDGKPLVLTVDPITHTGLITLADGSSISLLNMPTDAFGAHLATSGGGGGSSASSADPIPTNPGNPTVTIITATSNIATAEVNTPIALDLDGDGIEYKSLASSNVFFDIDGDHFSEKVEWLDANDGFLVRDLNGNGKIDDVSEMFGDQGGTTAWQKLAALDSNASNTLTSADTNWSTLRIWQDANSNGHVDSGELKTLASLNITSISTVSNGATTLAGHAVAGASTYVIGGVTRTSADSLLATDQVNSWYIGNGTAGSTSIDMDALFLPLSRGYGTLPSLHFAMTQDATLKGMMEDFVGTTFSATNAHSLYTQIDTMMMEWAGASAINPTSRGAYVDARHLAVLEQMVGAPYYNTVSHSSDPHLANGPLLEKAYETFRAEIGLRLMVQGPLHDLFPHASYDFANDKILLNDTLSNILTNATTHAPTVGTSDSTVYWSEIARTVTYAHDQFSLTETAAQSAVNTAAGFNVHIVSTYGTDGADTLSGNSSPYYSYIKDDVFWGGQGNDLIQGNGGSDTYLYNYGDGNDTISSYGEVPINTDTLVFGAGINPSDILLARSGDHLTISFNGHAGSVYLPDEFNAGGTLGFGVEQVAFNDGTTWDIEDMGARWLATQMTSGSDSILGFGFDDTIQGGLGNDTIQGNGGSDTYIYNLGDGNDTILAYGEYPTIKNDTLELGTGINPNDVIFTRSGNNLTLSFSGHTGSIYLPDQFNGGGIYGYGVEQIHFSDNTTWDVPFMRTHYLASVTTSGNDSILGFATDDTIQGGLGNDTLQGNGGYDTYIYNYGDGNDTITSFGEYPATNDTLLFGTGVAPSDVLLAYSGYNLTLSFSGHTGSIVIQDQFNTGGRFGYGVERVQFADGTVWDLDHLNDGYLKTLATSGNNSITGFDTNDTIDGLGGNDTIAGGNGNDFLTGNTGVDSLTGGAGIDHFIYSANTDSGIGAGNRDIITDFTHSQSDILDLSGFAGTFTFRGTSAFTGTAHEVNYSVVGGNTIVAVDSDGNGVANFEIQLTGSQSLVSGDFFL